MLTDPRKFQARQYQQNDGLSAWRMYFVANEWIKISTKRKCSLCIQILMVLLTIIVIYLISVFFVQQTNPLKISGVSIRLGTFVFI